MSIINIGDIRIKRGNTAQIASYTGPLGELVLNTQTNQLVSQDGITAGGHLVTGDFTTVQANLSILQTEVAEIAGVSGNIAQLQAFLANTNLQELHTLINTNAGNYGNSNVAAYLPTYGGSISANIVNGNQTWTFDPTGTGNLVIPNNSNIVTEGGGLTISNQIISPSAYIAIPYNGFDTGIPLQIVNNSSNQTILALTGNTPSSTQYIFDGTGNITMPISSGLQWPHMSMVYTDNVADSQLTITDGEGSTYSFRKIAFNLSDNVTINFGNNETASIYPDAGGNLALVANSASYTFGINSELTLPTGGHLGPVGKGWTGLDGGNGGGSSSTDNCAGTYYSMRVYNVALNSTQIAQNYAALKGTYGLS